MSLSYEWQRRNTLREFAAGKRSKQELCDAEFILVAASEFHGTPSARSCPICASTRMRNVLWVYGEDLQRASGSARTEEEIRRFLAEGKEVTVHEVEVCPDCKWNHILRADWL